MAEVNNRFDQDVRNDEAAKIIRKWVTLIDKTYENATLVQLLLFLRMRYQTASEAPVARLREIKLLKTNLSEYMDANTIDSVCQDEIMIDILSEFILNNISVSEIIDFICDSEGKKEFNSEIRPLLSADVEMTEETNYNTATESNKIITFNSNSIPLPGTTPKLGKRFTSTPSNPNTRGSATFNPNLTYNYNSTLQPLRNLSIKDAIELIPKFNGFNINLCTFLDGCREARAMIPAINEPDLAKLVKMRLYGEALKSAQNKSFNDIEEIASYFDSLYGSAKTFLEIAGELASLQQKSDENVVTFANRVKSIVQQMREAARREDRVINGFENQLEKDSIKYFVRGLIWVIKARMRSQRTLEKATVEAIKIERDFACTPPDYYKLS